MRVLTPNDIAIIIHSVMLHDCGMHLSEDGFLTLTKHGQLIEHGDFFGDIGWPFLWITFQEESRRFSGRTLRDIYGDEQPVSPIPNDPRDWTERHRLLIGEFIRRNHTRLAHDIAIYGIPGHSGFSQLLSTNAGLPLADMAGVVARSHGLDLRPCLDYIDKYYDLRDYTGAHLAFDMVVLRIADYLQIQSNRAPRQYSDIKRIRSPLSANEWKVHQSVSNIHQTHEDPEAVYVRAIPTENAVYLRLQSWLSDLQNELDKSWAVLGEVYGRFHEQSLDRLGLRIRRIRSNLDDVVAFSKSVAYIPGEFRLRADNVEVLALLVGPLYGDEVMCGVRELVQNAVDAVREMDELIKSGVSVKDDERVKCHGAVEVLVSETADGLILTVRDRGLGMSLNVLEDYFLRAGASYRRSDQWRKHFEDEKGDSKVVRSGRFGIGALAAFLLGDQVTIQSRSVLERDEPGYELTVSLGDEANELRKCNALIGTKITISLSEAAQNAFRRLLEPEHGFRNYGELFYGLRTPELYFNVINKELTPPYFCAQPGFATGWNELVHPDFEAIYWRNTTEKQYQLQYSYNSPVDGTFCNGIWIPKNKVSHETLFLSRPEIFNFRFPQISIFDPNGRLPVNLNRSEVNWEEASCVTAIATSVVRDLIKHISSNEVRPPRFTHNSLAGSWVSFPFVLCRNGVVLADKDLLAAAKITRILRLNGFDLAAILSAIMTLPSDCGVLIEEDRPGVVQLVELLRRASDYQRGLYDALFARIDKKARLFLISRHMIEIHSRAKTSPIYQRRELANAVQLTPSYSCIGLQEHDDLRHFCERLSENCGEGTSPTRNMAHLVSAAMPPPDDHPTGKPPSMLYTVWMEEFGGPMALREDIRTASGDVSAIRIRNAAARP